MTTIATAPISTDDLLWTAAEKTFTGELSDLQARYGTGIGTSFSLRSARTGRVLLVRQSRIVRDNEGDLVAIEYRPDDPRFADLFTVRLYND